MHGVRVLQQLHTDRVLSLLCGYMHGCRCPLIGAGYAQEQAQSQREAGSHNAAHMKNI